MGAPPPPTDTHSPTSPSNVINVDLLSRTPSSLLSIQGCPGWISRHVLGLMPRLTSSHTIAAAPKGPLSPALLGGGAWGKLRGRGALGKVRGRGALGGCAGCRRRRFQWGAVWRRQMHRGNDSNRATDWNLEGECWNTVRVVICGSSGQCAPLLPPQPHLLLS